MINRTKFFEYFRPRFHSKLTQKQVEGYDAIFNYWDLYKLRNIKWLAYVLATAYHETGRRMEPVREGFKETDEESRAHVAMMVESPRYPWVTRDYAEIQPNGNSYFGRGLVQITWGVNYQKLGQAIGIGNKLYDDPSLALDLTMSVRILFIGMIDGLFTGHKLVDYITDHKCDYVGARRIVNGLDRAEKISIYARKFEKCLFVGEKD